MGIYKILHSPKTYFEGIPPGYLGTQYFVTSNMKRGYLLLLCSLLTSAYMVFHAEGLVGIELNYAAQLTAQSVRGFENCGHHFPAAESALPAVDEPLTDILFLSSLLLLLCCCTRTLRIATGSLQASPS